MFQTKRKGEKRPFWSGQVQIYTLNYLFHLGLNLTITQVFIILYVHLEQEITWQFSKQIINLLFQLSVQVYSLLFQTEVEKKTFLEGARGAITL